MNALLKEVLDEAAKLAPEEQSELAVLILDELRSGKRWAKAFADSQDALARLADEALAEARAGITTPLDFERRAWSRGRRRGFGRATQLCRRTPRRERNPRFDIGRMTLVTPV